MNTGHGFPERPCDHCDDQPAIAFEGRLAGYRQRSDGHVREVLSG